MERKRPVEDDLVEMLGARKGHFLLESGHHGDLWLDLDALFLRPRRVRWFAGALAERVSRHTIDAVCGPLIGGAFVAQMIASELDVEFYYAERLAHRESDASVEYRIRETLRRNIRGKRAAVVDDVMNAGSAVRATIMDMEACGAEGVVIGALLVLGDSAARLAEERGVALESVARLSSGLWVPSECPLCAGGMALERLAD